MEIFATSVGHLELVDSDGHGVTRHNICSGNLENKRWQFWFCCHMLSGNGQAHPYLEKWMPALPVSTTIQIWTAWPLSDNLCQQNQNCRLLFSKSITSFKILILDTATQIYIKPLPFSSNTSNVPSNFPNPPSLCTHEYTPASTSSAFKMVNVLTVVVSSCVNTTTNCPGSFPISCCAEFFHTIVGAGLFCDSALHVNV